MASNNHNTIGLEFDNVSIRAAKCLAGTSAKSAFKAVDRLIEVRGDYTKEDTLIEGIKQVKSKLDAVSSDRFVTCLSGKQMHVAQIPFRKFPPAETLNALKFELRKNVPFDMNGATIDYQEVHHQDSAERADGKIDLLVSAVSAPLINRHLGTLGKADVKPWIVDLLPLAVVNSFWTRCQVDSDFGVAHVILHVGPEVCTLVVDGVKTPFYTRSIYFTASEVIGEKRGDTPERERERRFTALCEEVQRSLSFYEKSAGDISFDAIHLIGDYADNQELRTHLDKSLNLVFADNDLMKYLEINGEPPAGKFDVAIALALRVL